MLKEPVKHLLNLCGFELRRNRPRRVRRKSDIPDIELYLPLFSPWLGKGEFRRFYDLAAPKTLVSADRCHIIYTILKQAVHIPGDIWECGVYKGGTAAMIAAFLQENAPSKHLYLFDTFEGMPEADAEKDGHKKGDFQDTSVEEVASYVGHDQLCVIRKGLIPETFRGLESSQIAFAHIDVDIYKSILDCLGFIWPRLSLGGFIAIDDYGIASCPGARAAVDEFFRAEKCMPLCLPNGQALIFKSVA